MRVHYIRVFTPTVCVVGRRNPPLRSGENRSRRSVVRAEYSDDEPGTYRTHFRLSHGFRRRPPFLPLTHLQRRLYFCRPCIYTETVAFKGGDILPLELVKTEVVDPSYVELTSATDQVRRRRPPTRFHSRTFSKSLSLSTGGRPQATFFGVHCS